MFMTFEGGEGAGKSTQIKRLAAHLSQNNVDVVLTREPGGTDAAEAVRSLLVNGEAGTWSSTAEALLNYAARDSHLRHVIRPALSRGQTVLCDRFIDSTRAYQGIAGDAALDLIDSLEARVVGNTRPDITFIFDLDPQLGLLRAANRGKGVEDRYERKPLSFHEALHQAYLDIAKAEPLRCIVVDANQQVDVVWASILSGLKERGHGYDQS
jgi:dTMP kinase